MDIRIPAESFPAGEYIRDELDARGWAQTDLADILDAQPSVVNEIISGKRPITMEIARDLAAAFGTSAQLWMNLDSSYRLWKHHKDIERRNESSITHRARLYDYAPVREMVKRRWIEPSDDLGVLEDRLCKFFNVPSLDELPSIKTAARKSTSYAGHTKAQVAWYFRAKRLSRAVQAAEFDESRFAAGLKKLRQLAADVDNVRLVPKLFAELGVRLLVIEPIAKTKIDGATIWVDDRPIIVLSMRYDRVDAFWQTITHESIHVLNRDDSLDIGIVVDATGKREDQLPEHERMADQQAAELLIPSAEIDSFVSRHNRRISASALIQLANKLAIHPGVIVGQLHYRGALPYSHLRKFLMQNQIRRMLIESAVTDGWGVVPDVF